MYFLELTFQKKKRIEELGKIFNFISSNKRQFLDIKYELMEIIMKHAKVDQSFILDLKTIGGLPLLISFLDQPSDRFRLITLKLLGIVLMLNPTQSRLSMNKIAGFDCILLYLTPYCFTLDLCDTILGLGNFFIMIFFFFFPFVFLISNNKYRAWTL